MHSPRTLLPLALSALLFSCGKKPAENIDRSERPAVAVVVQVLKPTEAPLKLVKSGRLIAATDVILSAETMGVLKRRVVREGDRLEAQGLVASFDDQVERAEVLAAEARYAALSSAGTPLTAIRDAHAAAARTLDSLRRRTILAPSAGVIEHYFVEEGSFVTPGTPVARLVDPSSLKLIVTVLEEEVAQVIVGSDISFRTPAGGERVYQAKISRVGQASLAGSGAFEVEGLVAFSSELRPGFQVTAELATRNTERRHLVPRDAVFSRHGTQRLFIVANSSGVDRAEERIVTTQSVLGDAVHFDVQSGVEPGSRIIVRGLLGLLAGDPVQFQAP